MLPALYMPDHIQSTNNYNMKKIFSLKKAPLVVAGLLLVFNFCFAKTSPRRFEMGNSRSISALNFVGAKSTTGSRTEGVPTITEPEIVLTAPTAYIIVSVIEGFAAPTTGNSTETQLANLD